MDEVLAYETSEALSERQRVALRLHDAFLVHPGGLSAAVRAQTLEHFSPEELVGLLMRLTSFLVNKPRAALGIDRPMNDNELTGFDYSWAEEFMPEAG